MSPLPQPSGTPGYEEFLDMLAYMLATNSLTSEIAWIVGDVGMGAPQQTPFAYIVPRNDVIPWETANGQTGGLPTGGVAGLDMHQMTTPLVVAVQEHKYVKPVVAAPPAGSPVSAAALGLQPGEVPFFEQPGARAAMGIQHNITQVLRENITVGGEVATTRILETAYVLQVLEGKTYRALRLTLAGFQRRRRNT